MGKTKQHVTKLPGYHFLNEHETDEVHIPKEGEERQMNKRNDKRRLAECQHRRQLLFQVCVAPTAAVIASTRQPPRQKHSTAEAFTPFYFDYLQFLSRGGPTPAKDHTLHSLAPQKGA